MYVAVSDARAQLPDLVRRAEEGEEVILTEDGRSVARLVGVGPDAMERRAALEQARGAARDVQTSAARSQDFLYDETGLPA